MHTSKNVIAKLKYLFTWYIQVLICNKFLLCFRAQHILVFQPQIISVVWKHIYISIHFIKQEGPEGPGRSPEEKVKGHSGANNREPQGHNLNNFGK